MTQLGCRLLERLLALDDGYRGPRIDCGAGHAAEFVGYRAKTVDTVLGPVASAGPTSTARHAGAA